MKEEYREKINQIVSEIEDERDLWLILHFAQLRAEKQPSKKGWKVMTMLDEYRNEITRVINEITDERALYLIMLWAREWLAKS